ncbi:MAG: right-handed parallel beta-helix repeat-containing protein [Chthoniobacterales bacterium]
MLGLAQLAPGAEVWIAHKLDGRPGTGAKTDPLDGSTQQKFDAVMAQIPEGSRIHLGPGLFPTRGVQLKDGWHITGAGKLRTTIRLVEGMVTQDAGAAYVLFNHDWEGFYDRIEIADLTVDCNRANQPAFVQGKRGNLIALTTACRHTRISRVRALGTWANPGEGFPFSVISAGRSATNRVEIDSCENLDSVGSLTAIAAFDQSGGRISGFIRNCLVTGNPNGVGFGAGGWRNFAVVGNTTRGMGAGIVIDTHDYENVRIVRNRFYDTRRWGILYNGSGVYRDILVRKNYIEMAKDAEWALVTSNAKVRTQIEGNTFISDSTTRPLFWIGPHTSGRITRNILDSGIPSDLSPAAGLVLRGNRDLRGRAARLRMAHRRGR